MYNKQTPPPPPHLAVREIINANDRSVPTLEQRPAILDSPLHCPLVDVGRTDAWPTVSWHYWSAHSNSMLIAATHNFHAFSAADVRMRKGRVDGEGVLYI